MARIIGLKPSVTPAPAVVVHYICESWWACHTASGSKHYYRERLDSVLATEQGISVIPPAVYDRLDVVVSPERGWKGQIPTWLGVPCRIGRVRLWIPAVDEAETYTEFSLLVLLPRRDIEDVPPFVHLGTQFLHEQRAEAQLDCSSTSGKGKIVIP